MKSETGTRVVIPIPPSVNAIWSIVRPYRRSGLRGSPRLSRSGRYQSWLDAVVLLLRQSRPKISRYPIELRFEVLGGKDWRRRDLDNVIKPTIDALVKSGWIPDDSTKYVAGITVRFTSASQPNSTIAISVS